MSKQEQYDLLVKQAAALLEAEPDRTARAANFSAFVFHELPDLNWAGFYWVQGATLVVGPFQGRPACTRIGIGKGVCGTAADQRETVVVPNVHEFPGHIACDCASNSEIVVPVLVRGELLGVFDIDSPLLDRFDDDDREGIERLVAAFIASEDGCAFVE